MQTRQDQISYSFAQAQSGWIELQGITGPSNAEIDIVEPNGQVLQSTSILSTSAPGGTWDVYVPAGNYAIRVDANSDASDGGTVQFTPVQVPADQAFPREGGHRPDAANADSANPVSLWSLDAQAGDTLTLNTQTWDGSGSLQIISADGQNNYTWDPSTGSGSYTFTEGGTFLVRIVSNPGSDAAGDNDFNISATVGSADTPAAHRSRRPSAPPARLPRTPPRPSSSN